MGHRSGTAIVLFAFAGVTAGCARTSSPPVGVERPPVAVEVVSVETGDLAETIAVVGTLAPKFEGEVKAEYSGVIADVFVSEWVRVERGTLLARFDTREAVASLRAAKAARLQGEVGAARAKREFDRHVQLRAGGLATQQTLDDARSAADAAEAALEAAAAQEELVRTRLSKADIRAPIAGVIAARTVNPGDFVENMGSPRPMFTIVDNRRLELTATVPSSASAAVAVGQPLTFTVDAMPRRLVEGKVSYVNPAVDETSRTLKVIAQIDNRDGALKSGLFARGEIVTSRRTGVLRVARGALVTWDPVAGSGMVFVIENGRAKKREVLTGTSTAAAIEIRKGLSAGETVVTRGGFEVKDDDRVTVVAGAPKSERGA
ncbi:MAG: efflux RND transporter periplasmic adaptor subunit [Thermoanaerobaculia bacterium]